MPSRRDQLFSYQFMVQRVISAFVYRDAELVRMPFQRAGGTLFIGAMVGVLALAAVGIYGVVAPGGKTTWRNDQALIMEKETGARYVYLNKKLHPVANYVSARLILKKSKVPTIMVARASLKTAPRGAALGIVGVPDSLPEAKRLVKDPWVLCSRPGLNESGQATTTSVLMIGKKPSGGRRLGDEALLTQIADRTVFMVWHDRRFLVRQPQIVLDAMGIGQAPVISVSQAWINAIPQGPDIAPIDIANRGANAALPTARIGQVVEAASVSGAKQYYVVLADGIADITQVQADILLSDPATAAAYPNAQPKSIERRDLAKAQRSAKKLIPAAGAAQPPAQTPKIATGADSGGLCAAFGDPGSAPPVTTGAVLPAGGEGIRPNGSGVDEVIVAPGGGVLARSMMSADATTGTLTLVTDLGIRYALASADVVGFLGYSDGSVARVPASLLALLPQGQALDPEAAASPVATA